MTMEVAGSGKTLGSDNPSKDKEQWKVKYDPTSY